jgi:multicomponent Na+:H+ antiporter subunit G
VTLATLSDVLVVLGLVVMTVGVYGLYRMPDVYTQLHASSKAVFLGVIALLAASVATRDGAAIGRAALTAVFLILATPVAAHVVARGAYRRGRPMESPGAVDESGSGLVRGDTPWAGAEEEEPN